MKLKLNLLEKQSSAVELTAMCEASIHAGVIPQRRLHNSPPPLISVIIWKQGSVRGGGDGGAQIMSHIWQTGPLCESARGLALLWVARGIKVQLIPSLGGSARITCWKRFVFAIMASQCGPQGRKTAWEHVSCLSQSSALASNLSILFVWSVFNLLLWSGGTTETFCGLWNLECFET